MKEKRAQAAKKAAKFIRDYFSMSKHPIGLILGTGWGQAFDFKVDFVKLPFEDIPGFKKLSKIKGHERRLIIGEIADREVIILDGRVHLNEAPFSKRIAKMVRLQTEMLFQLGVKQIIATNAVGALKVNQKKLDELSSLAASRHQNSFPDPALHVGQIAVIDGFISLYAPPMPLWGGEFCSPDDVLTPKLMQLALHLQDEHIIAKPTGLAMLRGPQFEGRKYDKALLSKSGAGVVGMSIYPEACIAALYDVEFLGLGFVTNDEKEEHSHETNLARAKEMAEHLGSYLTRIITNM